MARDPGDWRQERRIVTALVADIVGSRQLTDGLDLEAAHEVIGGAVDVMISQVESLGGTVKELAGGTVLAIFGAPIAHEDDAVRGVLCAVRIIDAITEYAAALDHRRVPEGLPVRVGVESGLVVAGRVGAGSRVEYGATGAVLNTATRLRDLALPNSALIGQVTRALVGDAFIWSDEAEYDIPGTNPRLRAATALAFTSDRRSERAAATIPLVGRHDAAAVLRQAAAELDVGLGSVIVLQGEAGTGKTRLVDELHSLLPDLPPGGWLEAAAASHSQSTPFSAYRSMSLRMTGLTETAHRREYLEGMEALAATSSPAVAERILALAQTLGSVEWWVPPPPDENGDPDTALMSIFDAIGGLIESLASEGPTVIVLEDLHWMDPTSVALTRNLAELCTTLPLLMVITTRPDSTALAEVQIVGERIGERMRRCDLQPLTRAEGRELLTARLRGVVVPLDVEEQLIDTADGNPFYLLEQARALLESDTLIDSAGALGFVDSTAAAAVAGRTAPLRALHALAPRARFGVETGRRVHGPFIGRDRELVLLSDAFDACTSSSVPRSVLVVGAPGLGKSRLVSELFTELHSRPIPVTWQHGRCLPYGDGITHWALGEIVKSQAGILESDSPDVARAKLELVLPDSEERAWLRERLLPLLGIEAASTASREEQVTAWIRFLTHISGGPTVLVFEDLHWADESMLDFLELLTRQAERVPMMVVATARPELLERRPNFAEAGGATVLTLSALADTDVVRLVTDLLDQPDVPPELQNRIVTRSGGNPLFIEEFVHLTVERQQLERGDRSASHTAITDMPVPGTIQALVGARLDALDSDARALVGCAAVAGRAFWDGVVAEMSGRDLDDVHELLALLTGKEFIQEVPHSSIAGQTEYAFRHALIRDVAYSRLPRVERATHHVQAAHWLESQARTRIEDVGDVLAHHITTARALAQASANNDLADRLAAPALRFLTLAGDRALRLDAEAAVAYFADALVLAPVGHPGRVEVLNRFAAAMHIAGRHAEAAKVLDESVATLRKAGDPVRLAQAMLNQADALFRLADPRALVLPLEALALLEQLPPSPVQVLALASVTRIEALGGRPESAIHHAQRALHLASHLEIPTPTLALGYRGFARLTLGDVSGQVDLREAMAVGNETGQTSAVAMVHSWLAVSRWLLEGPRAALEEADIGIAFAQRRGLGFFVDASTVGFLDARYEVGELDDVLGLAEEMDGSLEPENMLDLLQVRAARVRVMALRGRSADVTDDIDWLEVNSLASAVDWMLTGCAAAASARCDLGQHDRAADLLATIESTPALRRSFAYPMYLPEMVRTALKAADVDVASRLISGYEPLLPYATVSARASRAAIAEHHGELPDAVEGYASAAEEWRALGVLTEEAFALLGAGRCLVDMGSESDAVRTLSEALAIFENLAAQPAFEETLDLLRRASRQ
jgi:predicted ATPase/class 3 adenylate cyclase